MRIACKFEELDDRTRAYLHDVRTRKGKGTPGIFVAIGSMRPMLAFLIGPTTALVLFALSTTSTKDAWAIAMLQTAALLIGGWTLVYAIRRWTAGRSKTFGGKFLFFDPLHAYDVAGEHVTITGLQTVQGVNSHKLPPRVLFEFKGDRDEVVAVPSFQDANLVADYFEAMDELEHSKKGTWSNVTPAELGAAAKYSIEEDETPNDVNDLRLDVDEIPTPTKATKAGFGLIPLLAILVAGGVLFLVLWQVNRPLGDDAAFDRAKENGAPGLRGYLIDDRNTRHRDEAKVLLAAAYDPAIRKLETAPQATNQKVRDGMIELVKSLKTAESPAVSLDVIEKTSGVDPISPARATRLRRELADALARGVDPKLIAFASPPEAQKAHITVRYEFIPAKEAIGGGYVIEVEIEIRTDIAAAPFVAMKWIEAINFPNGINSWEFDTKGVEELKLRLCRDLVGGFVSPPPVVVEPDDF